MAGLVAASSVVAACASFAGERIAAPRSAAVSAQMAPVRCGMKSDSAIVNVRRAVIAVAAASMLAIATPVFAETESRPPAIRGAEETVKKGSKEAKKKFSNICVSQPTASICHG